MVFSRNVTQWLCALAMLAFGSSGATADAPDRFVQDRFCISFWWDPPVDEHVEEHYRRIAEANFTVVLAHRARTREQVARLLDLCTVHDLKAMIPANVFPTKQLPEDAACWGYYLKDEPGTDEYAKLAEQVNEIRAARPGKLSYINLFPSHAAPGQWQASSYEEYVSRFLEEVPVDVLCFDRYPMMNPGLDERNGYLANLAIIREHAMNKGIPFWNFFKSIGYDRHYDPTEAQIRWQVYTSLAFGAKGLLYFTYWTPNSFPRSAVITSDGRPTRHYEQVKRINARLKNLGPTLMKLTSVGVYRVTPGFGRHFLPPQPLTDIGIYHCEPGEAQARLFKGSPIREISEGDYLIGAFEHEDGRRAVLLNNYRFAYTAWPTVRFDVDPANIVEVDQDTGREKPLRDDSPVTEGLQISLDSGEGRLFLLPAH